LNKKIIDVFLEKFTEVVFSKLFYLIAMFKHVNKGIESSNNFGLCMQKKVLLYSKTLKMIAICLINYDSFTFTAFNPFLPSSMSKVTSSFSLILSIKPVECTKYSFEEFVSLMNPNPFDSLKNFTVPLLIYLFLNFAQVNHSFLNKLKFFKNK